VIMLCFKTNLGAEMLPRESLQQNACDQAIKIALVR
jgi:hypothetical protein